MFNYTLDPCGPVYITVGDGGNIERVDVDHADDPGKCPSASDNTPEFGGVCHLNFSSGPAKGKFCWDKQPEWSAYRESSFGHGILEVQSLASLMLLFCKLRGVVVFLVKSLCALVQVVNSSYALWTWHRNQDIYKKDRRGDQIYIVRQPELCSKALKVIS